MDWAFPQKTGIPADLLAWAQNDLLARLLVQRGIRTAQAARAFTNPTDYEPAPPTDLPDMATAVDHLRRAIAGRLPVCVWGDFDVDGQTSTALLVSMLRQAGADVRWYVPHRLSEGHGLHAPRLAELLADGVKLVLTCDTGIDAHDAVRQVHDAGAAIIITDHHDLPDSLPPAEAVINPKRLPSTHPLRELPGVGVAFKLAEALFAALGRPEQTDPLLDLVALGIVADVAVQTADTRYLLQRGLAQLRRTARPGLLALIRMANLQTDSLTAEHIGFWLGPRLNALGRLGDANQGVELLTTDDTGRARIIAAQLDALNERRKLLVDKTVVQALGQLADSPTLAESNAIVLAAKNWHPGVLGIACSRLAEQFARPAILLTETQGQLRGSARSVPGCDIHQAIKTQANLLTTFGGHPMAAGLSLPARHLSEFRQGLSAALAECVRQPRPPLSIDAVVELGQLNTGLLDTIETLAPFGAGNPPVTLAATGLTVQSEAAFGRTRLHRKVTVADDRGQTAEVIWWNGAGEPLPPGRFDLAFSVERPTYRAAEDVQAVWRAARWQADVPARPSRRVFDFRYGDVPFDELVAADALFWASDALPGAKRLVPERGEFPQAKTLVIWQAPPGQDVLRDIVSAVRPEEIYLVARPSAIDTPARFIRHLMGLVKFALQRYGGRLDVAAIAAGMVHREAAIRLGIDWLVEQGKLRVIVKTADVLVVRPDNAPSGNHAAELEAILLSLLQETAAYRAFGQSARLEALGVG